MDDDLFADLMEATQEMADREAIWASVDDVALDSRFRYVPCPQPFRQGRPEHGLVQGVWCLVDEDVHWFWQEEREVVTTWPGGRSVRVEPRHITHYTIRRRT